MMFRLLLIVVAVIAVLISAGCSHLVGNTGPKTTIVLQVDPQYKSSLPKDPAARAEVMEQARDVLLERIRTYSIASPTVSIKGDDQLVVTVQSAKDMAKIIPALTSTQTLEFYHLKDVKTSNHPTSYWMMSAEENPGGEKGFVFTGQQGETISSISQPQEILTKVIDASKNKPILTGADLEPKAMADYDAQQGPVIRIEFNERGTRVFNRFTRANKQEILAIVYNGKLLTAPEISEAIPSGQAQISGFKNITEAKQVADTLNAGQMPVRLVLVNSKP